MGLMLGSYSVVLSVDREFYLAAIMIELAALCDGLDGLVARTSHTDSRFGIEYDSLADVVAFGVAPAGLAYMWALRPLGALGLIEAGLFVVCGALRLARFNVQAGLHKRHFVGLPIPGAAVCVAGLFFFCYRLGINSPSTLYALSAPIVPLLAAMMVSRVPYPSFKRIRLRSRRREVLIVISLAVVLLLLFPEMTLFAAASAYLLSGPVLILVTWVEAQPA